MFLSFFFVNLAVRAASQSSPSQAATDCIGIESPIPPSYGIAQTFCYYHLYESRIRICCTFYSNLSSLRYLTKINMVNNTLHI